MNRKVIAASLVRLIVLFSVILCASAASRATTVATPTFSPAAGSYTGTQSVTISDTTSGATIYYTTNGSSPTSSSTHYTGAISVSTSETIKAIAEKSGDTNSATASAAYTITVPTPTFSLAAGNHIGAQSVTISDATSGATCYYTLTAGTSGNTPTTSSTRYSAAIPVTVTSVLESLCAFSGDTNSAVASAAYTITVPTPTFSLAAGNYIGAQSVTISDATSGAVCHYTLTAGTVGTAPTTSSTTYSTAIPVTVTSVLESLCAFSGDTNSATASAAYTITVPTPTFSLAAGNHIGAQSVTISDATSGAVCHYTLTAGTVGNAPTTSSTTYSAAIPVTVTSVLESLCAFSGDTNSATASAAYTITVPTPTFSLAAGNYVGAQSVTISDATSGAVCHYTLTAGTVGNAPTTSSTTYSTAIPVTVTSVLESLCAFSGDTNSATASAAYTITVPTPTFTPVGGTYTSSINAMIGDSTSGATCHYTLTAGTVGNTPTTSSTTYSAAIPVTVTSVLESLCAFSGDTNSGIGTVTYTITPPPAAAPTYSLPTGTYTSAQTVTISDSPSGAPIYYTTDGSTPTTSSTQYSGAIHVTATETIEAIASGGGFSASPVASATYTIVPPGTVGTLQILISPPTAQSTTVSGALTETFDSLSPAIYTTPYVSTAGIGTYTGGTNNPIGIVAPNEFGGATDSQFSTPTNYFAVGVESGSTAPVTLALTHPAAYFGFWWSAGDAYNRVALYSGSTLYGTFSTADLLTFLNNGSGTITASNGSTYQASSYFGNPNITTGNNDGAEPFAYISFVISNTTIDHIVFYNLSASTGFESDNHSVIYSGNTVTIPGTYVPVETLTLGSQAAQPVFTPVAGSYTGPQTVAISTTTAGASINYTTDGTTPSPTNGTLYTGPITVSQTETIQAIAFETGLTSSNVVPAAYTITVPTPTFSPAAGTYASSQSVTISDATSGATCYYTLTAGTTGTTPSTSSTQYSGAISVTATSVLEALCAFSGDTNSAVASAAYTITVTVATPTFSLAAGGYTGTQSLTLSDTTLGATIYYTTDGSTPTSSSTQYTGAISVSTSETVKAIAELSGDTNSAVASAGYTITVPTPTFSPAAGTYASSQSVTISDATSGATCYYTLTAGTTGTTPSTSSTQYSGAISVTATSVLEALCAFSGDTNSAVASAAYGFAVSVAVAPTSATLSSNGEQQFTATVGNTTNTAVTWSILPSGTGSISQSGLYIAPGTVTTQQTVTVTATSQADTTKSASAVVTLDPANCNSNGYSYERAIAINHTKVPNSDQTTFPFLFNTTDPLLATVANGGHVQNPNGYDIIFTSDAAGQNPLPYEMEEYNPQTGQVIAWVQIPDLSHTSDTAIYMFYGNSSVAASQQNPAGVWGTSYAGVWHLPNGTSLSANDSTVNENNGTPGTGVGATAGFIDGGASFSGASTAYITLPSSSAAWNFANDVTVSAWIKTAGNGMGVLELQPGTPLVYLEVGPTTAGGYSNNAVAYFRADDGDLVIANGKTAVNDNNWHNIQAVRSTGNSVNIYVDGILDSTTPYADPNPIDASGGGPAIGGLGTSYDFIGAIDEVRVSNVARSSDWIATEYANQSAPSTFFTLSPEASGTGTLNPASVTLYQGGSQQFTVLAPGLCNAGDAVWSMPAGSPGMLSSAGLYTAPATIYTQQTVTVTATTPGANSTPPSATVTLMPPVAITVSPNPASVPFGGTQQFSATVTHATNTAVTWTTNPAGTGTINANGLYTAPNISFSGGNFTPASLALNGNATVTANGAVQFTDGGDDEAASAWYPAKVPVAAFSTNFSFQMARAYFGFADGITFTIQGDGITALGGDGEGLGYSGIPNSVAIKFDTFNDDGEGTDSTGLYTDGAIPTIPAIDLTPTGVILQSGDVMDANLMYDGTFLTLSLADTTTKATAQEVFKVDIPSQVGSSTAYVGFTGGTGAQNSIQTLLSWNYMSLTQEVVEVTATSQADPSASGSASVTLQPSVAISASPANVVLYGGQSQQFTANVINTTNTSVTWSISPASGAGSISSSGLFTAPGMVTTQTAVTVTATSVANPTATATLTVMLVPHVALTVTPSDATLYNGQTQQFTANVTGNPDTAVTWSLNPAPGTLFPNGLGMINAAGMYTAPANITNGQAVLVTATSAANSTVNATATVNLLPAPTTINIGLSATSPVYFPNTSQLSATVSDSSLPAGQTPAVQWSQISGPGTIAFSNAQAISTTALFSEVGTYTIQLTATDSLNSASAQLIVLVEDSPALTQGWIGSPMTGSAVSGLVPITVAAGETLASGTLTYYPTNNLQASVVLNADTTGSGQIGVLDTTSLANGSYEIALQATDSNANTEYSLSFVTVTGNYKPGRVTTTVTDLVVPATGLAINIQRTYDSLNAATIGDFGYGWNLGINVNLVVDSKGDVTFTLGGQRRTFYLTPQPLACSPLVGCLFPWFTPDFTPEPGMFGALTESSPGCLFDMLLADGECENGGYYNPPGYIYTDPTGTQYTIGATGSLQSVADRNGNGLTITPNGITSTTGLNVPFVRDAQNRITQITDPQGNVYLYGYDANGNLATVTYPPTPNSQTCSGASAPNTSQYTYYTTPAHFYESGTDARCNPLPTTQYYAAGATDSNGNSLAGKLQSVTDSLGETTSYAYTLSATSNINGVEVPNTGITAVTYPADAGGNVGHATMVYDSLGDLLSSTDPLNHTTTNTYNANQDLLSTTDPLGHTTSYTYDANGNKTSQTYPATATSTNTTSTTNYNQFSEPTSTIDELGNVRAYNYDANYNPASVTDSAGTLMSTQFNSNGTMAAGAIGYDITQNPSRASQFTYDANGDLASKTDALSRTTSYTYNTLGQKVTMVEPIPSGSNAATATTTYTYDAFGNLTQTSAPLGRVTSATYDGNSNKTSDTNARGHTTTYQYDNLNRLILTTYPDTTTSSKTYDFRNNVVTETDQGGHVTLHQYDLAGRQISVTQAYGTANATTTSYTYDNAGRKTSETDALSHVTNYTYDAAGDLLSVSGAAGNFDYAYDNARNQISVTDGNSNTTQYQYDARKRLTVTTYPDTTTKTNAYDGPGNLVSVTNQAGNEVQYTYDAANQLASVIQVNSPNTNANTTIYGYDANGNPITFEDANTHTTVNSFDLLRELTQKTLPDGTLTETRTYDNNGNLASVTHFNGEVTTYTYDTLNRLLSRATPGETTVSHTYTSTGKYATTSDASGATTYTYDTMDRLTAKATPEGTLNYTYDAAGHVASIASSNANGASMSYTYDSLNRLSTVVDNRLSGSNTTTYSYDDASNVGTVTYPNGVQSTFTYDTLNRVSGLSSQTSGYTYQRGPAGNLTGSTESSGRTESWSYDGIYRLTNETISFAPSGKNGSVGYGLDPVGNRTSDTSSLSGISSGSFSYNPDDELASESYDQNGNVLATGGKTFTYDSQNELISMGSTASLLYDADGNRVSKSVSGVVTKYLVDDLNPTGYPQVFDELTNGSVTRTYAYGLQGIDEDQVISSTWTPRFYGYDGAGNVRQLTNSAGAVTDTYEYDAFGNEVNHTGTTPNNYLYRGEQYDSDLGLYYLRARYYNANTGRFMSRDPNDGKLFDPKTLHEYLYAGDDPVNRVDPRGRAIGGEDELEEGELTEEVGELGEKLEEEPVHIFDKYKDIDDAFENLESLEDRLSYYEEGYGATSDKSLQNLINAALKFGK